MKVSALVFGLTTLAVACSPRHSPTAATSALSPPAATVAVGGSGHAEVGHIAPDFSLSDIDGHTTHLADLRGKTVVLEWFNPDCPFVRRNHTEGPLKDMAAQQMAHGVVWLSVNSAALGKQGYGVDANRAGKQRYAITNPILLDPTGEVGHAYGAKATPHMFVIAPDGTLAYRGAIDNAPDGDPRGSPTVINYVSAALAELEAGRRVSVRETDAYGCAVKYAP